MHLVFLLTKDNITCTIQATTEMSYVSNGVIRSNHKHHWCEARMSTIPYPP